MMFGDNTEKPMEIIREKWLSCPAEILQIPPWMLPMPVLAYNPGAFFSFAAAAKTHGQYGHFMWLIHPNVFASQSWLFSEVPVVPGDGSDGHYDKYWLKFFYNPTWTPKQRAILTKVIQKDLDKKWWKRIYDVPQLFGHLIGLKWIGIPGFEVCSDNADYLKLVDGQYTGKHGTPTSVNKYLKAHPWDEKQPNKSGYIPGFRFFGGD